MLCRQARGRIPVSPLSRMYHWVYKDGENGYDNKRIEEKFIRLSKGALQILPLLCDRQFSDFDFGFTQEVL